MSTGATGSPASNIASLWNNPTLLGTLLGGVNVTGLQGVLQAQMSQVSAPLQQLSSQQSALSAQGQAYSTVQGALSAVLTDAQSLQTASAFNQTAAPVSTTPSVATASGTGGPYGDYALAISSLATPGSVNSAFQAGSATSSLGWSGNMTVTVYVGIPPQQTAVQVLVPVGTQDSLQSIAQNIQSGAANALPSGTTLTATVLPTSQGGQSGNVLSLSVNGGLTASDISTSGSVPSLGFTNNTTFAPATYTINGVQNQSNTNTVTGALPNVTLNLLGTGSSTLSIAQNPSATAAQVNSLVTDIQKAVTIIQGETAQGRPLAGNGTLNLLANQLQSTLTNPDNNLAAGYQSLTDMGLNIAYTQGLGGSISFNQGTFSTALATNPQAVNTLFTGTNGLAGQLANLVQGFTQSGTGILASSQQAIANQESLLSSQESAMSQSITQQQTQLQSQFMTYLTQLQKNASQQSFVQQYTTYQTAMALQQAGLATSGG